MGFFMVCVLLFTSEIYAQANPRTSNNSPEIRHQVEIHHDNDFLLQTDRYYSSGLNGTYRRKLASSWLSNAPEQLAFSIGQEVYTPSNITSNDFNDYNRPYAGFLELKGGWSVSEESQFLNIEFALGLAGELSGAGGFQRWYHQNLTSYEVPDWSHEIGHSVHTNIYAEYAKEWNLLAEAFSINLAFQPKLALGTRDIYAQPELTAYFGRRNALSSSLAYDRIDGASNEIFLALHAGYRFVGYNGLLQGHLFGDDSPFLTDAVTVLFRLGADLNFRSQRNDFQLSYRFNTNETRASNSHQYIGFSYGRSF